MDETLKNFLASKSENDHVYFILSGGIVIHGAFIDWGSQAQCVRVVTLVDSPNVQNGVTLTILLSSIMAWGEVTEKTEKLW